MNNDLDHLDIHCITSEQIELLLKEEHELQVAAQELIVKTRVTKILSPFGLPIQTGSSVLGLMVEPEIDILFLVPRLDLSYIRIPMNLIARHPYHLETSYRHRATSNSILDERHYFKTQFKLPDDDKIWTVDVNAWHRDGWGTGQRRDNQAALDFVLSRIDSETRLAILWIKKVWYRKPSYRTSVFSKHIHEAVLLDGVRTPAEFEDYVVMKCINHE